MKPKMGKKIYLLFLLFFNCSNGEQLQTDCKNGIGEACNQLGKSLSPPADIEFFRKACNLGNTNGCVNLSEKVDFPEAQRVLKFSCEKGNTRACTKLAEKSFLQKQK
jgi:TPR repeat protein